MGTYTYSATSDSYSGSWKDDTRHGHGAYVFSSSKSQLVGNWKNGLCTDGKQIFADGSSLHSMFRFLALAQVLPFFFGKIPFPSLKGQFRNGYEPNGQALYFHSNGLVQEGRFESKFV